MITIAICDGEEGSRKQILGFCERFFEKKQIEFEITGYSSGKSLLVEDFPDVLFLNPELKYVDGILVKEILYKMHADTKIVFIANSLDRMKYAFGKNVYAFLKMPFFYEEFHACMQYVVNDILEEQEMVYCKYRKNFEKIFRHEISYIKAYGRYTKIFIRGKKEYRLSDSSFGEWYLEMENSSFSCCHRGYLVNLLHIKNVGKEIELLDEVKIPIGEKKRDDFYKEYDVYIRRFKNNE